MTKNNSVRIKKELALFQDPPHRRYFCHRCQQEVKICLLCDHGHKYCPICKKECKSNNNKKSNTKYRLTLKGKKTRAACESRRRKTRKENLENSDSYKIMGDPSTNISKVLPNNEIETVVVGGEENSELEERKNSGDFFEVQNKQSSAFRLCPERRECEKILCAYCSRECSNLSYNKLLQKRIYKKRYRETRSKYQSEGKCV